MLGKTHLVTGVTAASWAAIPLAAVGATPSLCLLSIPVGAYAALLPDIDHHGSWITWMLPPLSNITSWAIRGCPIGWGIPAIVVPLFGWTLYQGWEFHAHLAPWRVAHRYETHTKTAAVIFGLVLGLPLWLIPAIGGWWWMFAVQIMVGCLTHRWGDMRTTAGLPERDDSGRYLGPRTVGRTFPVGSDHEHVLRAAVYRPIAIASVIATLLVITEIGVIT